MLIESTQIEVLTVRRVLLPTDFSENAQHAINYALILLGEHEVRYFLLNSYSLVHNIPETLISLEDILHEQSEKSLKLNVDRIKDDHQLLDIEAISAYGDPPVVIKKVVQERNIDMVVLGSRGNRGINEALFGSTTAHVVGRIAQPILIVPLQFVKKVPRRIIFATDLIQVKDLSVLEPMFRIARNHQAEIVIMNVTGQAEESKVRKALDRLNFNNHFEGINYRFEVVQNKDILTGINEFIELEKADLLVLSPKQYPNFKGMFHRSVTRRVISRSEIPILVI